LAATRAPDARSARRKSFTIVGVVPPGFQLPDAPTYAWVPI
jgi:hypothetical protein